MSIIHNTTFILPTELENDFISFITERYLPILKEVTSSESYRLLKVITHSNEEGTINYALQCHFPSPETLENGLKAASPILQHLIRKHFGQNVMGFSTIMAEVNISI